MKSLVILHKPTGLQIYQDTDFAEKIKKSLPEYREKLQRVHEYHLKALDSLIQLFSTMQVDYDLFRRDEDLPNLDKYPLIITLGGDGTFISASHSLRKNPILGINSVPFSSTGHYCSESYHERAEFGHLRSRLEDILSGKEKPVELTRLELSLDKVPIPVPVLNDVLIAEQTPAATSRYMVHYKNKSEMQKSSGIWLSTATGSTAAFRSAGGTPFDDNKEHGIRRFGFVVREHYNRKQESIRGGLVENPADFRVLSGMAGGKIYIDGSHNVVPFSSGATLTINFFEHPLKTFL